MEVLPETPPSVADVRELRASGPWPSKSGGPLSVPISLSHAETLGFLDYDSAELARIGVDIRGLRVFFVSDAPVGGVAGRQFHRVRREIEFVIRGRVRWHFEDLYGRTKEIVATPERVVCIPPFILHWLTFEEAGSAVGTLANTVYVRDDPRTHDTYSIDVFRSLQDRMRGHAHTR
jgi:hypothetical protein